MAGRLQLESIGKQDKYFTDDPEFSFFSQMHKKHTHFSRQSIKLEGNKPIDFNEVIRFTIPQDQGDLLSKVSFGYDSHKECKRRMKELQNIACHFYQN